MLLRRGDVHELEEQIIARFLNGLSPAIKKIVDFQPYKNLVELVHQATRAERHVKSEEQKNERTRAYFASRNASTTASAKPTLPNASKAPATKAYSKPQVSMAPSAASSKASTSTSNAICYKCGGKGHKSFECINTKVMLTYENGDTHSMLSLIHI